MSDDITDALDASEPAADAKPLPPDYTQQTVATLTAKSKAARLNADKATPDIPLANLVKESLPHVMPSKEMADVISTFAKEPSPAAPIVVADRALVSLGSNVIRFPARRAA